MLINFFCLTVHEQKFRYPSDLIKKLLNGSCQKKIIKWVSLKMKLSSNVFCQMNHKMGLSEENY
jgi:hypothetical protein